MEDIPTGDAGPMDTDTPDALAPTSGEGWGSATETNGAAEGTLVTTEDTWGATPVADGW